MSGGIATLLGILGMVTVVSLSTGFVINGNTAASSVQIEEITDSIQIGKDITASIISNQAGAIRGITPDFPYYIAFNGYGNVEIYINDIMVNSVEIDGSTGVKMPGLEAGVHYITFRTPLDETTVDVFSGFTKVVWNDIILHPRVPDNANGTYTFTGYLSSPDGPISNVSINLYDDNNNVIISNRTNNYGEYTISIKPELFKWEEETIITKLGYDVIMGDKYMTDNIVLAVWDSNRISPGTIHITINTPEPLRGILNFQMEINGIMQSVECEPVGIIPAGNTQITCTTYATPPVGGDAWPLDGATNCQDVLLGYTNDAVITGCGVIELAMFDGPLTDDMLCEIGQQVFVSEYDGEGVVWCDNDSMSINEQSIKKLDCSSPFAALDWSGC